MPQTLFFEAELRRSARLPYLLYLPADYDRPEFDDGPDRPDNDESSDPQGGPDSPGPRTWPLLFFLHGAGERGGDPELVRSIGLPPRIEAWPECPFIVAAPQCPAYSDWVLELDALEALLDHLVSSYWVDPKRIYLTGMSMGGRGVWQLASRHSGRYAAIAPVCGWRPEGLYTREELEVLKEVPAWIFHGALDEVIPAAESEIMAAALRAAGAEVRLTIYPETGHDSWNEAYDTRELFTWLLGHAR